MNDELQTIISDIEMAAPAELLFEVDDKLAAMEHRVREYRTAFKAKLIEYIKINGPIETTVDDAGHVRRFYLGHDKKVKCRDRKKVLEYLLSLDLDSAADCLSSDAWKPGAFKKVLKASGQEGQFNEMFETKVEDKLEDATAAPLKLQKFEDKFLTA